jgi:hypothetical protein
MVSMFSGSAKKAASARGGVLPAEGCGRPAPPVCEELTAEQMAAVASSGAASGFFEPAVGFPELTPSQGGPEPRD